MSFWLKVRAAIRRGDELLPEIIPSVTDVVDETGSGADITVIPVEPVALPTPEELPHDDPQNEATQAEADAVRYINQVAPLLNLIGKTEGTDRGRGYNETLGYGAYTDGPVNLIKMTLYTVDQLQTKMLAHPKNKLNSSAVGRYQFIRTTLRALKKKWGINNAKLFDPRMQDDLTYITLVGRGLVRWRKGELSLNGFIDNLSAEWASLPNSKGKGTYKGQHIGCTLDELKAVLALIK